jgi:hypothetical protein
MKHRNVIMFAVALFCMGLNVIQAQTVTDIDGNVYKTVTMMVLLFL